MPSRNLRANSRAAGEYGPWIVLFVVLGVGLFVLAYAITQAIVSAAQVLNLTSGEVTIFGVFAILGAFGLWALGREGRKRFG